MCHISAKRCPQAIGLILVVLLLLTWTTASLGAQGEITGWTAPINFSNAGRTALNILALSSDPKQNTHMFWVERTDQQAYIYYSSDASGSWQEPIEISGAPRVDLLDAAIAPDLRAHLVWVAGNGGELLYTSAPLAEAHDLPDQVESAML